MSNLIFVTEQAANSQPAVSETPVSAIDGQTVGPPQPMVSLDPAGQATPLSYAVPEPMSYSGRNYITLDLPAEAFTTRAVDPEQVLALASPTAAGAIKHDAVDPPALPPTGGTPGSGAGDAGGASQGDSASAHPDALFMPFSTGPMSARLATLTVGQAKGLTRADQPPVVYTNSAGLLDYRPTVTASLETLPVSHGLGVPGVVTSFAPGEPPNPPEPPDPPTISVTIDTPSDGSTATGSSQGVTVQVTGRWNGDGFNGSPSITLSADGGPAAAVTLTKDTWAATVTFTASGQHVLTATGVVAGATWRGHVLRGTDHSSVKVTVTLTPDVTPPPVLPTVAVTAPHPGQILPAPNGTCSVSLTGHATITPAAPIRVTVTDTATGATSAIDLTAGTTDFTLTPPLLIGLGVHPLRVVATSGTVTSPEVVVPVTLSMRPAKVRITNKIMIVETLNLTSYLAAYGAGRCLKTFSLLAGETTTISVKSYRNNTETSKQAASILDSSATEASSDFDDAVTNEQTDKQAKAQSSDFKLGLTASASWGFGSAGLNATYSGAANSAREEAVKNVSTATRKHAMKASANRSVTVNTESASALTSTQEDSTIRQVANINVGRTLNYVFRQMNQEHIVLYHLTNARVAYYTQDIPLDANGKAARNADGSIQIDTNYQEVTLPELGSLLNQILNPLSCPPAKVNQAVVNALSGIPDYSDQLQSLVEVATPTDTSGNPVPEASYLRAVRNLRTTFVDPYSSFTVQVPGIVLNFDHIVQRTDGVFVDAILGQGDALDAYSHGLQDAAVAGKQADAAKAQLALKLVNTHDDGGASIYQKVCPPPPMVLDGDPRPAAGSGPAT